jgi:uncharacterized protein involved in exopolysaccharide biosynthesis
MSTPTLDRTIDLRHYFMILWRRKGLVILSSVTVLCSALIALRFMPNEYEAQVTLVFPERQTLVRPLEQVMGGGTSSGRASEVEEAQFANMMARIQSRAFLENVARILEMTNDPGIRAAAAAYRAKHPGAESEDFAMRLVVQRLQSRIRFAVVGPGIYRVIIKDTNPESARTVAKYVSELYLDDARKAAVDQFQAAHEFGRDQLAKYEGELHDAENALKRYQVSVIGENYSGSTVRAENFNTAEDLLRRVKQEAQDRANQVRVETRSLSEFGLAPVDADALRERPEVRGLAGKMKSALEDAVDDILATSGSGTGAGEPAKWPPPDLLVRRELLALLAREAQARAPQAAEKVNKTLADYTFARIDAQLQENCANELEQSLESFRRQAQSKPADDIELQRLQAEVLKNREWLKTFKDLMTASATRQSMEAADLGGLPKILDPAKLPLVPSRPDRMKILLAALLLGPVLGAGLAFLGETTDSTLRTLEDIRRVVPEPVLCTTPLLRKLQPRQRGLRRYWLPAAVSGVLVLTLLIFFASFTVLRGLATGRSEKVTAPEAQSTQDAPSR